MRPCECGKTMIQERKPMPLGKSDVDRDSELKNYRAFIAELYHTPMLGSWAVFVESLVRTHNIDPMVFDQGRPDAG